jgi:hypothetical protein
MGLIDSILPCDRGQGAMFDGLGFVAAVRNLILAFLLETA